MNGKSGKSVTAALSPQKQNIESLNRVVGHILGMAGCDHCGRIALLKIDLIGDPPPDLAKDGVISLQQQGF